MLKTDNLLSEYPFTKYPDIQHCGVSSLWVTGYRKITVSRCKISVFLWSPGHRNVTVYTLKTDWCWQRSWLAKSITS